MLAEIPVILQTYDLLEFEHKDLRTEEFQTRRAMLEQTIENLNDEAKKSFFFSPRPFGQTVGTN